MRDRLGANMAAESFVKGDTTQRNEEREEDEFQLCVLRFSALQYYGIHSVCGATLGDMVQSDIANGRRGIVTIGCRRAGLRRGRWMAVSLPPDPRRYVPKARCLVRKVVTP